MLDKSMPPHILTALERRQVVRHQQVLSEARGSEVDWATAEQDWLAYHAQAWREERHRHILSLQREEIARYKWIRSEEEHRDVGRQAAMEWVQKYAASWRKWYEDEYEMS